MFKRLVVLAEPQPDASAEARVAGECSAGDHENSMASGPRREARTVADTEIDPERKATARTLPAPQRQVRCQQFAESVETFGGKGPSSLKQTVCVAKDLHRGPL